MQFVKEAFYSSIRNTKNQIYVLLSLIVLAGFYFIFLREKPYYLTSNSGEVKIVAYNDTVDHGNSSIHQFTLNDSVISVQYKLKKGFSNPYIGLAFLPEKGSFDLSKYNRVEIDLLEHSADNYFLFFITKDPAVKDKNHRLAGRHSSLNIQSGKGANSIVLDLKNIETPNWWYEVIGQSPADFGDVTLDSVYSILLTSGVYPALEVPQHLTIKCISFYRNNSIALFFIFFLEGMFLTYLFYLEWLKIKKSKIKPIEIKYRALEIPEAKEDDVSFLNFIHSNYQDSDLTLTKVSKQSGVQERVISKHIADTYNCNFKTYINQIRIEEAQRLLANTQLSIGEIAYTVGFNSPSTFNKVFKKITGKSPSDVL
jgi:AraC-like DNA-binding protein